MSKHGAPIPKGRHKANPKQCTVPSCERPVANLTEGLCDPHMQRLDRIGDPMAEIPIRSKWRGFSAGRRCTTEGCTSNAVSKGYCDRHWKRITRAGKREEAEAAALVKYREEQENG